MFARIFPLTLAIAAGLNAAEEKLPLLKAGNQTFTNVLITSKTATDLYFMHAGGVGNVKLKTLPADLREKFGFDPAQAAKVEQAQIEAKKKGIDPIYLTKPPAPAVEKEPEAPAAPAARPGGQPSAPSFLGRPGPDIIIEKWLTPAPVRGGKWTFVDFWATWCAPCRASIPHLNELHRKFREQVVFIGLSDESEADVRKMTEPKIAYTVAIDTKAQSVQAAHITGIPHGILMDPKGVVRWEGHPASLTQAELEKILVSMK